MQNCQCCRNADTVIVVQYELYIPNAFRPASSVNYEFKPVVPFNAVKDYRMQIFDRWGQMVFETSTPEMTWDGTAPNGKPAPMGNYIWVSNFFDVQGFEHNQKGQVLLVR